MKTRLFIVVLIVLAAFYSCNGNRQNGTNAGVNRGGYFDEEEKKNPKPEYILMRLGLEEVECKTGFYISDLCTPIVIIKWKNASSEPISGSIEVKGIFIDNKKGEELYTDTNFFRYSMDPPLQSGLSKQFSLKSGIGYTSVAILADADISCQIYVENELYKTIKIKNEELDSDRIQ